MPEYVVQGSLDLATSSVLRIENGRGVAIYVREGAVWVAEQGERRDRILHSGQWHRLERRGTALCYALQGGVVTLTAPKPAGFARRIVLRRAGPGEPVELYNAARERGSVLLANLKRLWSGLVRVPAHGTSEV